MGSQSVTKACGETAMLSLDEIPSAPQPWARSGTKRGLIPWGQAVCPVSHLPWQGPFVHLTVMIAAYLGRVRTKATGETEVRG